MKHALTVTHILFIFLLVIIITLPACNFFRKRSPIVYTFEINSVVPGLRNPTTGVLYQQTGAGPGQTDITIAYTLKNPINTLPGRVTATIGNTLLGTVPSAPNTFGVIPAGTNFTSEFHGPFFPPGKYTLTLTYITEGKIKFPDPSGTLKAHDSMVAQATFDYEVLQGKIDVDKDGIDDRDESALLEKFRPYYKFSLQPNFQIPKSFLFPGYADENRPMDVVDFIHNSQMLTTDDEAAAPIIPNSTLFSDASKILFTTGAVPWFTQNGGGSDITVNHQQTNYYIDPIEKPVRYRFPNPSFSGEDWTTVMAKGNVGLYGHVVPIFLSRDPNTHTLNYKWTDPPAATGREEDKYYKIEYWQFYGYNACHCGVAVANHEGDWTTVQLLYNFRTDTLESVFFYEHGKNELRFDMGNIIKIVQVSKLLPSEDIMQFQGTNYDPSPVSVNREIMSYDMANFEVMFYKDPISQQYTHPVVFIENGAHEPWPGPAFRFAIQPNHDGDDREHSFLTTTPRNLGEVENPIDFPGSKEILHFNGNWGAHYGGARGPCTHSQWTWPPGSLLRSQIPAFTN